MKITMKTVKALQTSGRELVLWDDEVPRFGIRVKPSNVKSYLVQYRDAQGRSRRLTIGKHGVWTPELAREEAKRLLRLADQNENPADEKREARAAITVEALCREYLAKAERGLIFGRRGTPKKRGTIYCDKGRIEFHIIPLLGKKLVKNLTQADMRRFFEDVAIGKTACDVKTKLRGRVIVKGGQGGAKRALGLLGGIFSYAQEAGYTSENPARGVRRPADKRRTFRLEPEGWRTLGQLLEEAENRGDRWQSIKIAWLIALTGCRRDEISGLSWDEVDLQNRCIRFSTARIEKDGVKSGPIRALGVPAVEVLRSIPRSGSPYVFPAIRDPSKPYSSTLPKAWPRIVPDFSPHCLRHAFASAAEDDCGSSEITVAALLGHAAGRGTTRRYITKANSSILAAADEVSSFIWSAMTGRSFPSSQSKAA